MAYVQGPFDAGHIYVQWGGNLPGGEEFSCGVRMAWTTAGTSNDPIAMLPGISAAISAFHSDANSQISPRALLTFVKANFIGPDGHYASQTTHEQALASVPGGGNVAMTTANQVAMVVSLTTGFVRGPAHRGRFYMPLPCMAVQADGAVGVPAREALKGTANTLLTALNAVNAQYKVAVFSRKAGAPAHRTVTGIEVGRVLDTQRRRRSKVPENY
jgi:hypothetical protein